MEYLNVSREPFFDTSVSKFEYHTYTPLFQNSYGRNDEIRIPITNQDSYILPHKSFLVLEGKVANDTKPDEVNLSKNFISHLFSEIRVEMNGIPIETVRNPGLVSTLKYYLTMDRNEFSSAAKYAWYSDNSLKLVKKSSWSFMIPCKNLMGFFNDFKNVLINTKFELVLIRTTDEKNCVNIPSLATNDVKITISKISLRMPHLFLSDVQKYEMLQAVDKGVSFPIFFRTWDLIEQPVQAQSKSQNWAIKTTSLLERPRFVIVAFQTKRKNLDSADYTNFDHCSITNMQLFLNSNVYPYNKWNLDFDAGTYGIAYHYFTEFTKAYHDDENRTIYQTLDNYKSLCPIFVFDCLHQEETMTSGSISMRLEFESAKDFEADTICNILIIHDRIVNYCPLDATVSLQV